MFVSVEYALLFDEKKHFVDRYQLHLGLWRMQPRCLDVSSPATLVTIPLSFHQLIFGQRFVMFAFLRWLISVFEIKPFQELMIDLRWSIKLVKLWVIMTDLIFVKGFFFSMKNRFSVSTIKTTCSSDFCDLIYCSPLNQLHSFELMFIFSSITRRGLKSGLPFVISV